MEDLFQDLFLIAEMIIEISRADPGCGGDIVGGGAGIFLLIENRNGSGQNLFLRERGDGFFHIFDQTGPHW